MGRKRRIVSETTVITSKDVGTLKIDKEGKLTVDVNKKCSICGVEYTIFDLKVAKPNKYGEVVRKPNQWTEKEELAHKLSHVESVRARRILGGIVTLHKEDRETVLKFVNEHYAG